MRQLLKDNIAWSWEQEHLKEWDRIKDLLKQEPVLKFYNPELPTKLSSDASKDGLGAVLLQYHEGHWYPVAYMLLEP